MGPAAVGTVDIRVLGPLEVVLDGDPVEVPGRRERAVLALLAVEVGRPVGVTRLSGLLWADEPPRTADKSLQTFVSRLRHVLGDVPGRLVRRERSYLLALPREATDLGRFRILVSGAAKASSAGDAQAAVEALQAGLAIWRGEHLADLGDTAAANAIGHHIRRERSAAIEALVTARLVAGDVEAAVADAERELVVHPDHEPLWALLMRAHVGAGRPTAALEAYDRCRRWLAEELGLDPSPSLTDLHAQVLRGGLDPLTSSAGSSNVVLPDASASAASATVSAASTSAATARQPTRDPRLRPPPALTRLVGRGEEVRRLRAALASDRMVTLTGTGGVGKTRLALEGIASGTDPVWCDLTRIATGDAVEQAIAAAAGVVVAPGVSTLAAAAAALAGEPITLVLDNCEHVLDGIRPAVVDLLRSCPDLTMLCTSRQPLAIAGERVLPVAPLGTEAGGPAEALFRAAVERAGGGLAEEEDAELLERLCERLDGLPLALELAAPLVRTLGMQGVLDGLSRRFQLFDVAWDATGRERDLRATVAWSETLLPPTSRHLLRATSVFAGPFTATMAAEVCAPRTPEDDRALAGLVERSLVEPVPGSPLRYRLLENVRAYAHDALGGTALHELNGRHAGWIADRCDHVAGRLWEEDEVGLARSLTEVVDEIRAAVGWVLSAGDADTGLRIAAGLHGPMILGVRTDMAAWMQDLLGRFGDVPHPRLAAAWGARAHWLLVCEEDGAAAAAAAGLAEAAVGNGPVPPVLWNYRTEVASRAYDTDQAQRVLDQARAAGLPPGWDQLIEASIIPVELALGQHERVAERILRLAPFAEGTRSRVLRQLFRIAVALVEHGDDPPRVLTVIREVLDAVLTDETRFIAHHVTMTAASYAGLTGDHDLAAATFEDVLGRWGPIGAWRYEWNTIREVTALLAACGADEDVVVLDAAARSSTAAPGLIGDQLAVIDAAVSHARDRLPGDVVVAAAGRGMAMSDRDALAHAQGALARLRT
jgi:predicted ATPase/DNA-binding SARP family transcriptional activator